MPNIIDYFQYWWSPENIIRTPVQVSEDSETRFRKMFMLSDPVTGNESLEQWFPQEIATEDLGQAITVQLDEAGRLDTIADRYLGDWKFWWVIAHVNGIRDVVNDVVAGMELRMPADNVIKTMMVE